MVCLKNSKLNGGLLGDFPAHHVRLQEGKNTNRCKPQQAAGCGCQLAKETKQFIPGIANDGSMKLPSGKLTRLWTQSQVLNSYMLTYQSVILKKHHHHWAFRMLTLCTISISVPTALHGPTVTPHTSPRPQRRSRKPPSGADRSKSSQAFMQWVCLMGQTCWTYVIIVTSLLPSISINKILRWLCWLPSISKLVEWHQQFYTIVCWNMWHQNSEHATGFGGWGKAHIIPHHQLQGVLRILHLSSGFATFIYHHIQFVSISLNHSR